MIAPDVVLFAAHCLGVRTLGCAPFYPYAQPDPLPAPNTIQLVLPPSGSNDILAPGATYWDFDAISWHPRYYPNAGVDQPCCLPKKIGGVSMFDVALGHLAKSVPGVAPMRFIQGLAQSSFPAQDIYAIDPNDWIGGDVILVGMSPVQLFTGFGKRQYGLTTVETMDYTSGLIPDTTVCGEFNDPQGTWSGVAGIPILHRELGESLALSGDSGSPMIVNCPGLVPGVLTDPALPADVPFIAGVDSASLGNYRNKYNAVLGRAPRAIFGFQRETEGPWQQRSRSRKRPR